MKKDLIISVIAKILQMGSSFIIGIVIARYLHAEGKGIIESYIAPFSLLISISTLGVPNASAYFLSKEKWSIKVISMIHSFVFVVSGIFTSFLFIFILYYQNLLNNQIVIVLLVIQIFTLKFISSANSIALSNRWITKIVYQELIMNITNFILIIITIIFLDRNTNYFFFSLIISSILSSIFIYMWIRKIKDYRFDFSIKRIKPWFNPFFSKGILYALPLFVFNLNYSADIIILDHYVSKAEIGYYSVSVSLANLLFIFPSLLGRIIMSYSFSTNKENEYQFSLDLWKTTKVVMSLATIVVILIYFIVPILIPIVYGKNFISSILSFKILLLGTLMMISFKMLNGDLIGRGKPELALVIFSISALLNIIGNIYFIPKYGITAAAWTSTITYTLGSLFFVIFYYYIVIFPQKSYNE